MVCLLTCLQQEGENILVCDAGGGTVDISTYKIVATTPSLVFDEICVGIGKYVTPNKLGRH